jgi:rod shape-determining protein MreD
MLTTFFFFLGIILIVVQTTVFQLFPMWLGRPDLVYILVAFTAYRFDWLRGFILVYTLGWMMDVVSGMYLGTYAFQSLLVFFGLKLFTENSPVKETAYQIPLVGLSYFFVQLGFFFFYSVVLPGTLPNWSWNRVMRETIILVVATIPCFLLFNSLFEYFQRRRLSRKLLRRKSGNQFR